MGVSLDVWFEQAGRKSFKLLFRYLCKEVRFELYSGRTSSGDLVDNPRRHWLKPSGLNGPGTRGNPGGGAIALS